MKIIRTLKEFIVHCRYSMRHRTVAPINFFVKSNRKLSHFSDDFLIVRLKHEFHLLEKCIKNDYSSRGHERYFSCVKLLEAASMRGINEPVILAWAEQVLQTFTLWRDSQQIQVTAYDELTGVAPVDFFDVKSTRFFKPIYPEMALIHACLAAAQKAAASCNRQAFKIGILKGRDIDQLGEANNNSLFAKAPYRLFIFYNRDNYAEKYAAAIDAGMFVQNFTLQAKQHNIACCSCYGAEYIDKSQAHYRQVFGLDDEYYCLLSVVIGYAAEDVSKPPRRNLENIIINTEVAE